MLEDGEVSIETLYLSLDPALRCRMNEESGVDYMKAWQVGETILGLGGVGQVTESRTPELDKGDLVHGLINWPWIQHFKTRTDDKSFKLTKVDAALKNTPQVVLSLLGMTGLTSLLGVKEMGHVTPGANQTFVVSAAAGACGNLAGQIAKLLGAGRVVGICGSDTKCSYLTTELGFDGAVNYKSENVTERLKVLCPEGIHIYFDNVGGIISDQVIQQMVNNSHVVLCGQIAVYNTDVPYPPPITQELQDIIKQKHITRERFLVINFEEKFSQGLQQLQEWYLSGKLKVPEFIHESLVHAAEAFVNMMTSKNQDRVGKQMIHVGSVLRY